MNSSIDYSALLPVELWLACWTLCSRRQLRRLSLVCHLFRSITFPLLLQNQTVDVVALGINEQNWAERVQHLHCVAVRVENLKAAPHATSVRSWTVAFGSRISGSRPRIGPGKLPPRSVRKIRQNRPQEATFSCPLGPQKATFGQGSSHGGSNFRPRLRRGTGAGDGQRPTGSSAFNITFVISVHTGTGQVEEIQRAAGEWRYKNLVKST
ncbi:hypothetical protein B0H16DRAFT_263008 [Mycena metata]|uniref:F-box domain-containing protein n=1 Tax=Mycena metata TaxID=1033252 RepID=A0AAD7MPY6_9AGAR|nr:hypothetical protein B0H16DRAFT_263008 [Mycena metata]